MEMLTMESINKGLELNKGVAGKIMNKRQMESSSVLIKEEVRTMDSFDMVCKFINSITVEEIYNTDTVEYMDADVVGVVGNDIEIGVAEDDRVELIYGDSYVTDGIRYTDSIDLGIFR